jgi:hypothetical protein
MRVNMRNKKPRADKSKKDTVFETVEEDLVTKKKKIICTKKRLHWEEASSRDQNVRRI